MALRLVLVLLFAISLSSCASRDAGRGGGTPGEYKVGKPYQIDGVWYYPKEDYGYDETGIASWYGPGFHGNTTANGESFDQNELTAAHRTLPMPSLVRVTNLENGRSVVVRVNDRGPYANGRIIDLSRRAAQLLGFEGNGTAKVRVQMLDVESRAIADAAKKRGMTGYPVTQTAAKLPDVQPPVTAPPPPEPDTAEGRVAAAYGNENDIMAAPEPASRGAVESVSLDGPSQKIVPLEQPKLKAPKFGKITPKPMVQEPKTIASIPGHQVGGRFYPAPEVRQTKVTGANKIYVQAGAFTVKDNALRLKNRLAGIAPASVTSASVHGTTYYRVRLGPIASVKQADSILSKVLGTDKKARITVE